MDLDGLGVKLKTVLTGKELLEILALVALELDHLAHLSVVDDGAIAGCVVAKLVTGLGMSQSREGGWVGGGWHSPNFFLTTARIFFRLNFAGMP